MVEVEVARVVKSLSESLVFIDDLTADSSSRINLKYTESLHCISEPFTWTKPFGPLSSMESTSGTSSKDLTIFSIKFKMKFIMHYMTLSVYRLMSNRFLFPLMSEHFATVWGVRISYSLHFRIQILNSLFISFIIIIFVEKQ